MDLATVTRDPCTCHQALHLCPACTAWEAGFVLIGGVRACTRAQWQAAHPSEGLWRELTDHASLRMHYGNRGAGTLE